MTICNAPTFAVNLSIPTGESVTHCKLELGHKGFHDNGCMLFKVSRRRGKDMLQPVLPTTTIPDVCWAIRWTTRLSSWFYAEVGADGQASLLEGPFTFMLGLYWTKEAARKKVREFRSYVESADCRPTDRPTYRLVRFTWKPLPLKVAAPAAPAASPPPEATPETTLEAAPEATPETALEATPEATPEAAVPAASKDRVHAKLQEKVRAERDQARTECERLRGECTKLRESLRLLRALHEERYAKIVELSDRCAAHEHVIGQVAARHGHEYALRQAISLQDTLLAENEKVRESLRGSEAEVERLRAERDGLRGKCMGLRESLRGSEAEVERLRAERDGLRAGWESLVARLREVKAELVTSREVIQAACDLTGYPDLAVQQGIVRLREEIGRLVLGAVRLGNEVTELRAEAHAMRTETEAAASAAPAAAEAEEPLRYTDDVPPSCDHCSKPAVWTCNHRAHCDDHRTGCTCSKYADRHASLERRLERRDDTIVRCEIRIEAARLKRDELLGAREKLQAEVKAAQAQITELKAERDAARAEALRMRKAVLDERTEHDFQARNLDEENAKLRGKLEELRGQFSELIDERNQLNQRVHEKDEHRKAALGDSQNLQARLKEDVEQYKAENKRLADVLDEHGRMLTDTRIANATLDNLVGELRAENAHLHARREEDIEEFRKLREELTRAQHEVADADVERYSAVGAAREKEKKKHIEAFETLHAKYMELKRENEAIGAELREAQKQIDELSRVTSATPSAYEAVRDRTKLIRDWAWNSKGRKVRLPVEVTKELCEFLDGLPLVGSPAAPAPAPAAAEAPAAQAETTELKAERDAARAEVLRMRKAVLDERTTLTKAFTDLRDKYIALTERFEMRPAPSRACTHCGLSPEDAAGGACDALAGPEHDFQARNLDEENAKLRGKLDALSAECKELHGRISDGDDREDQLASEKESLRIQLEESKRETAQWLQRVDQIRAEEKIIGGQLVEVTKERDALVTVKGALEAERNQLRVESDGLRAQVEVLKSAISWKDDQWRRTGEEKGETAVERMRDAEEIRGLHATIRALREDNKAQSDGLRAQVEDLKSTIQTLQEDNKQLGMLLSQVTDVMAEYNALLRLSKEREEQTVVHLEAARKAACDASGYPDEEILVAIHRLKGQAANLHDARNAMGAALVAIEKELGDAIDRTGPNAHKPEVFLVEAIRGVKGARDAALRDFMAANAEARKLRADYTDLRARVDGVIASVYAKTGAPAAPVQTVRCHCTANDRPPNASCVFCKGKGVVALAEGQS